MKIIKRIISALLLVVFCLQGVSVFAEGDPNIDNGGGNLQDGSKDNFWNPGNDGVRVTIVDSQTGLAKSSSIIRAGSRFISARCARRIISTAVR